MGVEPITATIGLGVIAIVTLAAYLDESERQKELRRRHEENMQKLRREERKKEKEARREEREREREEEEERERIREWEEEMERERIREWRKEREREERLRRIRRRQLEEEENELRRWYALSQTYSSPIYSDMFEFETSSFYINSSCGCYSCRKREYERERELEREREREEAQSRARNSCNCSRCQPMDFNPFRIEKKSVNLTVLPPQTTQNKNQNSKNQVSNTNTSSTNNQGAATSSYSGNASKQNANSAQKASSSESQQPQRNNSNNNNDNNSKKDKDYGELNAFIDKLKAVLDRCNVSAKLRKKILSFFDNFKKHEENFLRILDDFNRQDIDIEDVLSIVIRLFQTDYFATDVAYNNFIALMEIVAKYIKDEAFLERTKQRLNGNKESFDKLLADCMKKVVQRSSILTDIIDLFDNLRKQIIEDNTNHPLQPDFSGIFTKVYHYFKHKLIKGREWSVSEYFNRIRLLLAQLTSLDPEYEELTDPNHSRRGIIFEVYSTAFQGRFLIIVRAYGTRLNVCTFYWKKYNDKKDKKAIDGDKYVDGKKKP